MRGLVTCSSARPMRESRASSPMSRLPNSTWSSKKARRDARIPVAMSYHWKKLSCSSLHGTSPSPKRRQQYSPELADHRPGERTASTPWLPRSGAGTANCDPQRDRRPNLMEPNNPTPEGLGVCEAGEGTRDDRVQRVRQSECRGWHSCPDAESRVGQVEPLPRCQLLGHSGYPRVPGGCS